ncbi:MAG: hypothetical protein QXF56_05210 [Candidatus Micrarchaeia archaeon]
MAWALDDIIKKQKERDVVFDIVRDMQLTDRSKQLDVQEEVKKLMPILKEKGVKPDSEILHEQLGRMRETLEKMDPEKAKKLSELQEELKKRKLE